MKNKTDDKTNSDKKETVKINNKNNNTDGKQNKDNKKENIIIFCAHSDDQIFGVGGTIAKYSKESKNITTIIFSYGESSHPWLKEKYTIKMRVQESEEAGKVVGCYENIFFGLEEFKFAQQILERNIKKKIKQIILDKKPTKIFTHSMNDPHKDHQDVYYCIASVLEEMKYKGDLYCFDVWNPINIKKRDEAQLYVDITKTFNLKLEALKCFKSQKLSMLSLLWSVYLRASIHGRHSGVKYAERFFKLR